MPAPSNRLSESVSSGARNSAGLGATPRAGFNAANLANLSMLPPLTRKADPKSRARLLLPLAPNLLRGRRRKGNLLHMRKPESIRASCVQAIRWLETTALKTQSRLDMRRIDIDWARKILS